MAGGFELFTAPRIVFGAGALQRAGELLPGGPATRVLLVVGERSATDGGLLERLEQLLPVAAVERCAREPWIKDVDRAVQRGREAGCDGVVAAGGGAVLDCGKAASGMLTNPGSLQDYLEGVGRGLSVDQMPAPMMAIPTTAGTGSEVTKNAVISGPGYKKSLRSPHLIPRVALVDPELTHSMSPELTAACGMDALTQLVEAYLSRGANPVTDALALQGIAAAGAHLARAYAAPDVAAREQMALASLLGGICLANAGLGAVHGFASPLGALQEVAIPHGVACAALLPQVVQANLEAARGGPQEARLVRRTARIGRALTGEPLLADGEAMECCLDRLRALQRELQIPTLGRLGVTPTMIPAIVQGARGSSMRFNPVDLDDARLERTLALAL